MVFKNVSLQISLPVPGFLSKTAKLVEGLSAIFRKTQSFLRNFFFSVFGRIKAMRERKRVSAESKLGGFQERKPRLQIKKHIKPILAVVVLAVAFVFIARSMGQDGRVAGDQIEVGVPEKTFDIGREFLFPLRSADGEKVADIKYKLEKAEIIDQIIVKGKRATAVKGRTFLIISLKISNEYPSSIKMNSKDYVRLSVNGNEEEWLAPDIHNDPVEVQAISTKNTRIGFPINDTDNNLVLRIGEIEGEKEKIPLEF